MHTEHIKDDDDISKGRTVCNWEPSVLLLDLELVASLVLCALSHGALPFLDFRVASLWFHILRRRGRRHVFIRSAAAVADSCPRGSALPGPGDQKRRRRPCWRWLAGGRGDERACVHVREADGEQRAACVRGCRSSDLMQAVCRPLTCVRTQVRRLCNLGEYGVGLASRMAAHGDVTPGDDVLYSVCIVYSR